MQQKSLKQTITLEYNVILVDDNNNTETPVQLKLLCAMLIFVHSIPYFHAAYNINYHIWHFCIIVTYSFWAVEKINWRCYIVISSLVWLQALLVNKCYSYGCPCMVRTKLTLPLKETHSSTLLLHYREVKRTFCRASMH